MKAKVALVLSLLSVWSVVSNHAQDTAETDRVTETAPGAEFDDIDWDETGIFDAGVLTVTGTRTEKRVADSPVATEIISGEEIENSSAATLSEVLDDYGLMYSSNAMGDYIMLQGLGESRVLYLVDGKRVVGRTVQRINGETLPLDNIERIEIVRGPQSALYGSDGIGGVINIITKKPKDEFSLSAGVSNKAFLSYDDPDTETAVAPFASPSPFREQEARVRVGGGLGPTRNTLSLEGGRGDFYYGEGERASILPRYWRGRASLDSAFEPSSALTARLGASLTALQSDQQTSPSGSLARSDYLRAEGSAELGLFLDTMDLGFRLYDHYYRRERSEYSGLTEDWRDTDQGENENLLSAELSAAWYGLDNWIFNAGLEGSLNTMEKYNLSEGSPRVDREALFFQAEYYREEKYSVVGGFRAERNSRFGFAGAPKLSGMYRFTKAFRVLGSVGLGYRAPAFNDLYLVKDDPPHPLVLGSADLRPEYALSGNLGFDYMHGAYFFSANGYYTELFDEIVQVNTGRIERGMIVYETGNIARSLRAGIDTEGRAGFLSYGYVSAGYSYVFAWDRKAGEELHPQPAHTVKFRLGLDTGSAGSPAAPGKLRFLAWAGGRYFSALYPDRSDSQARFILDAYAALSFASHFKVYVSADNLLGTIDVFFGPSTPQSFSLGLQYTL